MQDTAQNIRAKRDPGMNLVKWVVYGAAVLVFGGSIWYGAHLLSSAFSGGFSGDVFMYPLMMVKKMLISTLLMLAIVAGLFVYGIKHKKLWYLLPIGIMLLGFYWYSINSSVHKAYVSRYGASRGK